VPVNRVKARGLKVRMIPTSHNSYAVDVPEDLLRVEEAMSSDDFKKA